MIESNCSGALLLRAPLMCCVIFLTIRDVLPRVSQFPQGFAREKLWAASTIVVLPCLSLTRSKERHTAVNQSPVPRRVFPNALRTMYSAGPMICRNQHHHLHFAPARLLGQAIAFVSMQDPPHRADADSRALDGRVRQSRCISV